MLPTPDLPGAESIVAWWGRWIGFHDFYLLAVPTAGASEGELLIHGWVTHADLDKRGAYRQSRHCGVRVLLSGIRTMELSEPETPAILFELEFQELADGWRVAWSSSFGCSGSLEAASVRFVLEPGRPDAKNPATEAQPPFSCS
jgi:hypothetical protein